MTKARTIKIGSAGKLLGALGAAALFAVSLSSGPASAQAQEVIKWGFASPYSGSAAEWGPMHEASAALAINDINAAGGIKAGGKTYRLELVKYDHGYDPAKVVSVAQKAVQQDGIKFLEILGGGVIAAAQPITEPAGVVLFASGVGSAWLGPKNPMTFRSYYDSADTARQALQYIRKSDAAAKKVVLMYPDDELGHKLAEVVIPGGKSAGFEVEPVFTGRSVTDFYPVLLKVMALKPDYIDFGPTPSNQYASIVKQAGELGYKGKFIFSDTVYLSALQKVGVGDAVVGSVVAPAWVKFDTPIAKSWADRYRARVGSIHAWTAQSYDNLMLFKAAVEKAGSPDPKAVAKALEEVTAEGITGKVSYGGEDRVGVKRMLKLPESIGVIKRDASGALAVNEVGG